MLKPNSVFRSTVTRPSRPSVARKAKASGTPAKLEATPEKVSVAERTQSRQAAAHDGDGDGKADQARRGCAEARLTLIEIQ